MTNQEAFNEVWAWTTRPDACRAMGVEGNCMYKTWDGNRCAIGGMASLVPIFDANEVLADCSGSIRVLLRMARACGVEELPRLLSDVNVSLLEELQDAHDTNEYEGPEFAVVMREKLARIAESWGLQVPGLAS